MRRIIAWIKALYANTKDLEDVFILTMFFCIMPSIILLCAAGCLASVKLCLWVLLHCWW